MGASRRNSAAAVQISGASGAAAGWSAPVPPAPAAFPSNGRAGHAIGADRGHEWRSRRGGLGLVAGVGAPQETPPQGADIYSPYDSYLPYESAMFGPTRSTGPKIIEIAAVRAPRRGHLPVVVYGDPLR